MPLYMDIHKVESDIFTVEDVVKAHMQDVAIQEKFGVIQIKYWVNERAKTIFCLMVGPDREACNQVHKESHGGTACNIIEVADDEYNLYLGSGTSVNDLAYTVSGELDTGYRTILLISMIDLTGKFDHYHNEIRKLISQYKGIPILQPGDGIMFSFVLASGAILCALAISKILKSIPENHEFTMALASGKPVDEQGNKLFGETKKRVKYLCELGVKNMIFLDSGTQSLSAKEPVSPKAGSEEFRIVQDDDFVFLSQLYDIFYKNLENPDFNCEKLLIEIGLSRSQAYRKIKSLTGFAPNKLLQEWRLRHSLKALRHTRATIAEIAFSSGFNSPTYFTKVFRRRFVITPTSFVKTVKNLPATPYK